MDRSNEYVAEPRDVEGSPCIVCPEGHLEVSTFTKTMERGGTTLVVKEVPALVWDTCGDVSQRRRLDGDSTKCMKLRRR